MTIAFYGQNHYHKGTLKEEGVISMLNILLIIVSACLIILSLLQSGKSDAMSAFTGTSGLTLFSNVKERGSEKIISNLTMGMGVLFFVLVIVINMIG